MTMEPNTTNTPKEILDLLRSGDLMDMTERIAEAHSLSAQYYGALYRATRGVITGTLPPGGFMRALEEDIGGDHDELVRIAQEINRDIFSPMKDSLAKVVAKPPQPASSVAVTAPVSPANVSAVPARPVTPPSSRPQPSPSPQQAAAQSAANNLESRLGGNFTIKKEIMYSQTGAPAPITPPSMGIPPAPPAASAPVPTPKVPSRPSAPLSPAPVANPTDSYREAP